MKKIALSMLILCATFAIAAPNPSDYNVTVHVIASESHPTGTTAIQEITVIIDGKKCRLQGASLGVLALGDYKAKLTETHRNSYDIYRYYQFLMPDGKTRDFTLSAISK
jgi:hypothetical protein